MAVTHKIAMEQQPLPLGWNFSVLHDAFIGPNGEHISRLDVEKHGSFFKAHAHLYGSKSQHKPQFGDRRINPNTYKPEVYNGDDWVDSVNVGSTGAIGAIQNGSYVTGANGPAGPFSIGNVKPAAEISVEGKLGRITINLDTGELKMPPNVGRDAAIRDFWLGFQENFQPTNKAEYEKRIKELQQEVAQVKATAALMRKDDEKEAAKKVAEKIAKKYNGEKFIMVKPEDLIRFIEAD